MKSEASSKPQPSPLWNGENNINSLVGLFWVPPCNKIGTARRTGNTRYIHFALCSCRLGCRAGALSFLLTQYDSSLQIPVFQAAEKSLASKVMSHSIYNPKQHFSFIPRLLFSVTIPKAISRVSLQGKS